MKSMVGNLFGQTRMTVRFYRFLTNRLLHSQSGAPRKWCQWFREHLLLARRYGRIQPADSMFWLFDPGWTITPLLLTRLATARGFIATQRDPVRPSSLYNRMAVETILDNPQTLGKDYVFTPDRREFLEQIGRMTRMDEIMKHLNGEYHPVDRTDLDFSRLRRHRRHQTAAIDLCLSMGVLEHYHPAHLDRVIRLMWEMLRTGGVVSHIIDHRDHFWHADKSISPFEHLTHDEKSWRRLAGNELFYTNRLLQSDYVRLFEAAGFETVYLGSKPYPQDAPPLPRHRMIEHFAQMPESDFRATVTHLVAIKK